MRYSVSMHARGAKATNRRTWLGLWAVLIGILAAVACSDDSAAPVPTIVPSSVRAVPGPWPDAEGQPITDGFPDASLVAVGGDRVLAVWSDFGGPPRFSLGDVADGGWRDIEPPGGPDEMPFLTTAGNEVGRLEPVALDGDAYLIGGRCALFNLGSEEYTACPEPGDFEVWRFDADDRAWEEIMARPFADLPGSPDWASIRILGVTGGQVVAQLSPAWDDEGATPATVVIDPEARSVEQVGGGDEQAICVTDEGLLVGTSLVDGGRQMVEVGEHRPGRAEHVTTRALDGDWVVHDTVRFDLGGGLDHLLCGRDSIYWLHDDLEGAELRWTELDGSGVVIAEGTLPGTLALAAHLPDCPFVPGQPVDQFSLEAPERFALVRDFGHVSELASSPVLLTSPGDVSDCYEDDVEQTREIVVLPEFGAEPIVQRFPERERVAVRDTTRLPDGRLAMLVDLREYIGGSRTDAASYQARTEVLVAE